MIAAGPFANKEFIMNDGFPNCFTSTQRMRKSGEISEIISLCRWRPEKTLNLSFVYASIISRRKLKFNDIVELN